jgi:hypothetical protein
MLSMLAVMSKRAAGGEPPAGTNIFVQRGEVSWYAQTSETIDLDTPVAVGKIISNYIMEG